MINFGVTEKKRAALEERMSLCGLKEEELQESFVRSSGPGGQKVNKTSSCVVLQHRPTGLEVKMQKNRSQGLNRYYARKRMCELLEKRRENENPGRDDFISPATRKAEKIRRQKQRRKRRHRQKHERNETNTQND